ncbi:Uncharacterised protein [Candidatus Anstonella stagnisolia]|nr:Uncharacterised protein [Candidatus Anstonella stagnisolia]
MKIFGITKGQAAMEYLMTYGWALLVIVVVLAALLFINPFRAPEQCTFDTPSFVCGKPLLTADNEHAGKLYGKITNGFSSGIYVYEVICSNSKEAPAPTSTNSIFVPASNDYAINGIECKKDNTAPMSVGEDFSGKLYVYYKLPDDGADFPRRVASATLSAKAQKTTAVAPTNPTGNTNTNTATNPATPGAGNANPGNPTNPDTGSNTINPNTGATSP